MIPKNSFVGSQRCRTIDFYKDDNGKYHMIVGLAQGNVNSTAGYDVRSIEGGTKPVWVPTWGNGRVIVQNQGCQAAAIHPTTGDLYFLQLPEQSALSGKEICYRGICNRKENNPCQTWYSR
ncbi:hypothetical protein NXW94_30650 [Bacteroides ovatus]|nr:hypothetical protein [Bacteroides ovatus]